MVEMTPYFTESDVLTQSSSAFHFSRPHPNPLVSVFVLDSAAVIHLRSVSTGAPTAVSRSQFGPVYWEAAQPSSLASSGDSTALLSSLSAFPAGSPQPGKT